MILTCGNKKLPETLHDFHGRRETVRLYLASNFDELLFLDRWKAVGRFRVEEVQDLDRCAPAGIRSRLGNAVRSLG